MLLSLGLTPGRRTYRRLEATCDAASLVLPAARLPDRSLTVKTCTGCKQTLPVEAFAVKLRARSSRQSVFRPCHSQARRDHDERNKPTIIAQVRARNREVKLRNATNVVNYLLANPCVDCGESDPMVLQYVWGKKAANIAELIPFARWEVIDAGTAKCVVR